MTEMGLKFLLFVGKKMLRKLEKKKNIFSKLKKVIFQLKLILYWSLDFIIF